MILPPGDAGQDCDCDVATVIAGEATEAGFRRELAGDYRYLSFATHGLLRDDLQGLADPALVLTPGAAPFSFTLKRTGVPFFWGLSTMWRSRLWNRNTTFPGPV